jgi:hypothetical protein
MFSAAKIAGRGASTSYSISRSLRFRSSASAYLNRTPSVAGNRKTWTWSGWVKRGTLGANSYPFVCSYGASDSQFLGIYFNSDDTLAVAGYSTYYRKTTQVFRDPSSWYHIVAVFDTTQSVGSNRVKLYINGSQVTSFGTSNDPTLNTDYAVNNNQPHFQGCYSLGTPTNFFDGYMTEVNFIDGQALTPTSFGAFNATTGVWQPLKYTGTYGNNGFYLPFSNNTSTTTLGADSSGNGNNWTCNNISLTAGTTYDSMLDVPTLTSATAANYCVLNPLVYRFSAGQNGYSNANLTLTGQGAGGGSWFNMGTIGIPASSGKFYFECQIGTASNGIYVGVTQDSNFQGSNWDAYYDSANGVLYKGASTFATGLATATTGDVIGVAYDSTGNTCAFYKNNTLLGTVTGLTATTMFPLQCARVSAVLNLNYGQRPFTYTPPTGFVALNSYNLPTPTISNGALYMAATTYTGNLTGQSITNGGNNTLGTTFQPDLVWIKSRSAATDHKLTDNVRGATKALISNSTAAETTDLTGLTTFNSNGFTVGASTVYNNTGVTYVGWQWLAGAGSSSSNTSGTITSTVSVNTTAGFSVVTYTGTGANATVGHGLGIAPSMIITKKRNSTSDWAVYHASLGNTSYLILDSSAGSASSSTYWNNTSPTSSVFSIGTADPVNISSATYVAYCFAPIAGYSAFGVYTGNGVADGPFTYTGFRPRYLILKKYSAAGDPWWVIDSSRSPYNQTILALRPSAANAEDSGVNANFDFLSNGFKARTAGGQNGNESGATYIWMAFAENPFKYSLAR